MPHLLSAMSEVTNSTAALFLVLDGQREAAPRSKRPATSPTRPKAARKPHPCKTCEGRACIGRCRF